MTAKGNDKMNDVDNVAESKTHHAPFSPTPSQPAHPHLHPHLAPVPSPIPAPPHARRQELALALVSSPASQQSHQYAAAQLAAKSLTDALEVRGAVRCGVLWVIGIAYYITLRQHTPSLKHLIHTTSLFNTPYQYNIFTQQNTPYITAGGAREWQGLRQEEDQLHGS